MTMEKLISDLIGRLEGYDVSKVRIDFFYRGGDELTLSLYGIRKCANDGTSGQDRESYSDDQDRDSYTVD